MYLLEHYSVLVHTGEHVCCHAHVWLYVADTRTTRAEDHNSYVHVHVPTLWTCCVVGGTCGDLKLSSGCMCVWSTVVKNRSFLIHVHVGGWTWLSFWRVVCEGHRQLPPACRPLLTAPNTCWPLLTASTSLGLALHACSCHGNVMFVGWLGNCTVLLWWFLYTALLLAFHLPYYRKLVSASLYKCKPSS